MDKHAVKLAPSILAADFTRLGQQVAEAEQAGADRIHVDVMDGHFVPNLSMGPPILESLRRVTRLALETHLMISDPDSFLEEFVAAGSDSFLVHWQVASHRAAREGARQARWRGHQPGNTCVGAGGNSARRGSGFGHDGQSGFRTLTFSPHDAAENSGRRARCVRTRSGRVLFGSLRARSNRRRAGAPADLSQNHRDLAHGSLDLGGARRDHRDGACQLDGVRAGQDAHVRAEAASS